MPNKNKKPVERCKECGATSHETMLEKVKGTSFHVCEDCAGFAETQTVSKSKKNKVVRGKKQSFDDDF